MPPPYENETSRRDALPRWSFDKLLSFSQLLVIVVGALWALFEYQSFRRENDKLTLERLKFEVNQQNIQRQQQELAIETARLTIASEKTKHRLSELDLERTQQERFAITKNELTLAQLGKFEDGTRKYLAQLSIHIENTADTAFEISYNVTEFFVGIPPARRPDNRSISQLNPPPDMFSRDSPGHVTWNRAGYQANIFGSKPKIESVFREMGYDRFARIGGLVSTLSKGQSSSIDYHYFVRARPDDIVAFVVNVGINDALDGKDAWFIKKWQLLAEADRPPEKGNTIR